MVAENKTKREKGENKINKTRIEWVKNPDGSQGYTWNPITGCLNHVNGLCKGGGFRCYACKLANTRLKQRYLANGNLPLHALPYSTYRADPFYPRFWEEKVDEIWKLGRSRCAKAKGIFACDMSDLFGIGVPEEWTKAILDAISHAEPHRFYLLTKQPQNLIKWSPFPENCWVGVSVCNQEMLDKAAPYLAKVVAGVKFISFEPLLGRIDLSPYIGYNKPIDKEDSYASEIERRSSISGCGTRGVGDRQFGTNLEGQKQVRDTLGQGSPDGTMSKETGGKRCRQVFASQSHGELETNLLPSSQISMEAFSRADTRRLNHQPQEWQQEGQQARESRTGNLLREHSAHAEGSSERQGTQPARGEQCRGETNRGCGSRDKSIAKPNSCGGEDPPWTQGGRVSQEICRDAGENLGCDLPANLELSLIIIGQQTPVSAKTQPRIEDLKEIVQAADKAGVKVFLKDNLKPILCTVSNGHEFIEAHNLWAFKEFQLRQELPGDPIGLV